MAARCQRAGDSRHVDNVPPQWCHPALKHAPNAHEIVCRVWGVGSAASLAPLGGWQLAWGASRKPAKGRGLWRVECVPSTPQKFGNSLPWQQPGCIGRMRLAARVGRRGAGSAPAALWPGGHVTRPARRNCLRGIALSSLESCGQLPKGGHVTRRRHKETTRGQLLSPTWTHRDEQASCLRRVNCLAGRRSCLAGDGCKA